MSEHDRKAIVDILQGAAIVAVSCWCMPHEWTWIASIPVVGGLWGAHRFDRGCKNLKNGVAA